MQKRLKYIFENILPDERLKVSVEQFDQVVKISEQLRMFSLKYNQMCGIGHMNESKAKQYIGKISEMLMDIKDKEKSTLNEIVKVLEKRNC